MECSNPFPLTFSALIGCRMPKGAESSQSGALGNSAANLSAEWMASGKGFEPELGITPLRLDACGAQGTIRSRVHKLNHELPVTGVIKLSHLIPKNEK